MLRACCDDADWQPLHYARRQLATTSESSVEHVAATAMVVVFTQAMELAAFEPQRPRGEAGQRMNYLSRRGAHNVIPQEKRDNVLHRAIAHLVALAPA